MTAWSTSSLAHIASGTSWSLLHTIVAAILIGFVCLLVVEHAAVKHGSVTLRSLRKPIAAMLAAVLTAVVAPAPGFAQSTIGPMGLPDLISDPPFIWIERDLHDADGEVIRVLSFDGFLHNIGEGALDLAGNPQIEGGIKQRVFDGEEWSDVGEPLVRFENDDGHNHFHLINAATYSLWDEGKSEQVEIGSKIGFCLLDTFQIERGVDATYNIDEINYCNVDEPDSTDLRMGISPGWVDVYEASVTLQWVDVSNTPPGRYWVGAVIDPNNEIVESNEDNNDLVFSSNKYAVSGYVARQLPVQESSDITLKSIVYGTVGQVAYVIADPPEHGTLSVPTNFDILHDTIAYTADPGYVGPDSFSYYAHDINTVFPFDAEVVTVEIAADGTDSSTDSSPAATDDPSDMTIAAPSTDVSATRYERISMAMQLDGAGDNTTAHWFAKNLPAGLTLDPETGQLEGELIMPGLATSTIIARVQGQDVTTEITWKVEDRDRASLRSLNDFSTSLERRDILVGAGTAENTYSATGLPEGVVLTEGQPSILGVPTEIGDFDVVVTEWLDDEKVDTVRFTMTVRPSVKPEFVL